MRYSYCSPLEESGHLPTLSLSSPFPSLSSIRYSYCSPLGEGGQRQQGPADYQHPRGRRGAGCLRGKYLMSMLCETISSKLLLSRLLDICTKFGRILDNLISGKLVSCWISGLQKQDSRILNS